MNIFEFLKVDSSNFCHCCQVASVMSDSVRPHGLQPTRLLRPWDSPGKNTGVGCHFLLQCMKVESKSEVIQSYLTLSDPMDCSLPGFSIHGIFQARVLSGVPLPSPSSFYFFPNKMFIYHIAVREHGLPWWLSDKELTCQSRR